MGCVVSKKEASVTPPLASGAMSWDLQGSREMLVPSPGWNRSESGESSKVSSLGKMSSVSTTGSWTANSTRLGNFPKHAEGEQAAAGWPVWLTAVAGEAIQGWVPLKADSFQKLEKIGQGTYSTVFRAREIVTGKIVALKKVRFDNFEPESVKFMAREIQILRRLNHPNVLKLEGLITSHLSCSLYLVFEYMEHDLSGLSSCPDIKFSEAQVKCYIHQLLSGLAHCHSRGIMHRDIKCANVLVNNEGIVKIADFGLANYFRPESKQPLTSRVVTLWYRAPELLLGSTDYEPTVDLWSVGCVFAEMLLGKPILQGRTEVEQLHKIFKLCGSPSEEYWRKFKLPHAPVFKPQHPYESCLHEAFESLTPCALTLLEALLSIDPYKRGTASSALSSEYFKRKPYACEPSSLPKYPPTKEIDAKGRESQRTSTDEAGNELESTKRRSRIPRASIDFNALSKAAVHPGDSMMLHKTRINHGDNGSGKFLQKAGKNGNNRLVVDLQPARTINPPVENRHTKHMSQIQHPSSGPLHFHVSSGFEWAKKQKDHAYSRSRSRQSSRSNTSLDPLSVLRARHASNYEGKENGDVACEDNATLKPHKPSGISKNISQKQRAHVGFGDSFDFSKISYTQDFSEAHYKRDAISSTRSLLGYQDQEEKVEFSGPLLSRSSKVDEFLEKHERHIRQAVRRSVLQRGVK